MQVVPFSPGIVGIAFERVGANQAITVREYNALVADIGRVRDQLARPDVYARNEIGFGPQLEVRGVPAHDNLAQIVGWTGAYLADPATLAADGSRLLTDARVEQRRVLYDALGYTLQRLRQGRRLLRTSPDVMSDVTADGASLAALTGEVELAALAPESLPTGQRIELDPTLVQSLPSVLALAREEASRAVAVARGAPLAAPRPASSSSEDARRSSAASAGWMAREYETSAFRFEIGTILAVIFGMLGVLALLGAFRRQGVAERGGSPAGPVPMGYGTPRVSIGGTTTPFSGF